MATLLNPTSIYPPQGGVCSKAIFHMVDTGYPTYYHFKTNVPLNSYIMCMVEAVGYSYGARVPIRCAWTFYAYQYFGPGNGLQNSNYTGLTANGIYLSSDNYYCIRANTSSGYYTGFVLNAYTLNPTGAGFETRILAATANTNSGNAY